MRWLITGYKGFIGTNLIDYLQERGESYIGIDYPTDLCKVKIIDLEADIIVHLAAETNVRNSIQRPYHTFIRNCQSTSNVLNYALNRKARVIFVSSCGAVTSDNPYTASKLACEGLCVAYRKTYNLNISILRLSNVYGPHSENKTSVIAKFIKAKLAGQPVDVYGTGHQKRDFVYVGDVCRAIYSYNGFFTNISTGRLTSINTLLNLLDIKDINYFQPIDGEIFNPRTTRWPECKVSLEDGLESTLEWFKSQLK
jgi:UDP-glucose 4-epimerase